MSRPGPPNPRYPGGWGVLWGVAAFLVGYLLTDLVVARDPIQALGRVTVEGRYLDPKPLSAALEAAPPTWEVTGGFHFGSHLVSTVVKLPTGSKFEVVYPLSAGGAYLLLLAIPPVTLTTAGAMATRQVSEVYDFRFDLGGRTWHRYFVNGGLIVTMGYLPATMLGLLVYFDFPQPNPVTGWILAGLAYPLVFGGVGGLLAYRLGDYRSLDVDVGE